MSEDKDLYDQQDDFEGRCGCYKTILSYPGRPSRATTKALLRTDAKIQIDGGRSANRVNASRKSSVQSTESGHRASDKGYGNVSTIQSCCSCPQNVGNNSEEVDPVFLAFPSSRTRRNDILTRYQSWSCHHEIVEISGCWRTNVAESDPGTVRRLASAGTIRIQADWVRRNVHNPVAHIATCLRASNGTWWNPVHDAT